MSSAPAKKPAARKPAKPANHPPFKTMIQAAVVALSAGRQKASRQAIQKHVFANNPSVEDNAANRKHINRALARMATSGAISRKSGTGASGSFRPPAKPVKPAGEKKKKAPKKKTATPKKKKPATKAKSPKKPAAKKPAAKKPAAKKAAKSPKKPAAKKPAAKKPAAKKPAAKKPAAKKPAKAKTAPKK